MPSGLRRASVVGSVKEKEKPDAEKTKSRQSWIVSIRRKKLNLSTSSLGKSSGRQDGRQNQVQAYMAWINGHLRKRDGVKLIEDMQKDMADGISLVHLVEIVSSERIAGIMREPSTVAERKANIERVLSFMVTKRIVMHQTAAKDIVGGNLKATMRLVLALAAHYKPNTMVSGGVGQLSGGDAPLPTGYGRYPCYVDRSPMSPQFDFTPPLRSRSPNVPVVVFETAGGGVGGGSCGSDPSLRQSAEVALRPHPIAARNAMRHSVHGGMNLAMQAERRSYSEEQGATQTITGGERSVSPASADASSDPLSPDEEASGHIRVLPGSPGGRRRFQLQPIEPSSLPHRPYTELPPSRSSPEKLMEKLQEKSLAGVGGDSLSSATGCGVLHHSSSSQSDLTSPMSATSRHSYLSGSLAAVQELSGDSHRWSAARELALEGMQITPAHRTTPSVPSMLSRYAKKLSGSNLGPALNGELLVQHLEMEEDVRQCKELLNELQQALLTGLPPDIARVQDDMPDEMIVLQAQLQQKNNMMEKLETKLCEAEYKLGQVQGRSPDGNLTAGLEARTSPDGDVVTSLRSEVEQLRTAKKSLEFMNEENERKVEEKHAANQILTSELEARDATIQELHRQLEEAQHQLSTQQTPSLDEGRLTPKGSSPSPLLCERLQAIGSANPDGVLSGSQLSTPPLRRSPTPSKAFGAKGELRLKGLELMAYNEVVSALDTVKQISASGNVQETIQTSLTSVEMSLSGALEKLEQVSRTAQRRHRQSPKSSTPPTPLSSRSASHSPPKRRSPQTRHVIGQEAAPSHPLQPSTKVVYYMDNVEMPFRTAIHKRLSDITLRDFKEVLDRQGFFRFHFKTKDPEFGVIKEELWLDTDHVPGFEGNIIAWVDEDPSVV